jgi:hypothetical protein
VDNQEFLYAIEHPSSEFDGIFGIPRHRQRSVLHSIIRKRKLKKQISLKFTATEGELMVGGMHKSDKFSWLLAYNVCLYLIILFSLLISHA